MNLQLLRQSLSEFGLNPNDWVLKVQRIKGTITCFEISGRKGQAFSFAGWAEQNRWLTLSLEI